MRIQLQWTLFSVSWYTGPYRRESYDRSRPNINDYGVSCKILWPYFLGEINSVTLKHKLNNTMRVNDTKRTIYEIAYIPFSFLSLCINFLGAIVPTFFFCVAIL